MAAASAENQVAAALDRLLAEHDPKDKVAFLGAQYDLGLAWVHFPVGHGGLGVRPELNRIIEERLRKAGAQARMMLIGAAAQQWNVSPNGLRARCSADRCSPLTRSTGTSSIAIGFPAAAFSASSGN